MRTTTYASAESRTLIAKILNKLEGLSKPTKKFFEATIILFLSMRGRINFKRMSRYGRYCEMTYHTQFAKGFDFLSFNSMLCKEVFNGQVILAFDASFIPKSGKHTPYLDNYYDGCSGKPSKGLEISSLSAVSLEDHTDIHLHTVQTQDQETLARKGMSRIDYYAQVVIEIAFKVYEISRILVVDGYFAKISFLDEVCEQTEFTIISKARKDLDAMYLYKGPKKPGKGRPRVYDGKIDFKNIDKRRFKLRYEDEEVRLYQIECRAKNLKRNLNLVYVEELEQGQPTGRYTLLFSTDMEMDAFFIWTAYKARFQIEFLFRNGKQHLGLTHCQSRNKKKLHYHFNMSLTSVNIAKAAHFLSLPREQRKGFSLEDIKIRYFNELMLDLFLFHFEINPKLKKNKRPIESFLNFGRIAV